MTESKPKNNDQVALVVKYFLDNYPLELFSDTEYTPKDKKEELAGKYLTRITEVFRVFDRLCRYEKYFSDFYPSEETGISEAEAVEYHLTNYVQEFYILRERIRKLVEHLKKDLEHYDIANTEEIKQALNHIQKNIDDGFKKINDELRREHVHEMSILDLDLTRSRFFHLLISGEIPVPEGTNLDMDRVKSLYKSTIGTSKGKHTQQAAHNSSELKRVKQSVAARFGYIFSRLNGHEDIEFDMNTGFK
ncbi:MAG: hypothetical protein ABH833_04640 [Parcubacteria group bacterium]